MPRTTKNLNPSAAVRREPAEEYLTAELKRQKRQAKEDDYIRFNVYVPRNKEAQMNDFAIYCKDQGISVSWLINNFMAQTVEKHAAEIEEAKERFEKARKYYKK